MAAIQSKYIPEWVTAPRAEHRILVLEQIDAAASERRTFDQKAILFGRVDKVCDVLVSHVSASRVHACVGFDDTGKLQIGDLGSTHGDIWTESAMQLEDFSDSSKAFAERCCTQVSTAPSVSRANAGTFVNGDKLKKGGRRELHPNDSFISIGLSRLKFRVLGSEPPQTAATASADLAVLNKHPASKANSPNEVTTSEPLRKDTGASHVIPPTAATAAAARQPVLQHPPQSSLPDSVKPKSQSIAHAAAAQNAAQKHVVGEELDAKAVTDVADQQGQGGTGGVDKPQRPAALRIGLDDKPAEDHVVGEEQNLRLSTATEHHHGQKRTRDVQQSVGGSVHMLSGGEIGNNAARADRQVTSSVPGQQRDANANTSCEANARQEGHEPGSSVLEEQMDVEDGEMPEAAEQAKPDTASRVPAGAVVGEEVNPQASTSEFEPGPCKALSRHQHASARPHAVGEELHPQGASAGFLSNRRQEQASPSATHRKRISKGAVVGEDLDERAVNGDASRQAKRHRGNPADVSIGTSPDAIDSSQRRRPNSDGKKYHDGSANGQCSRRSKEAELPASAEAGHISRMTASKDALPDKSAALGDPASAGRVGATVPPAGSHHDQDQQQQQQQLSAGSYSSSDSESHASPSHPLPLPSWRQQEQLEPEEEAPREAARAAARPASRQGSQALHSQTLGSPTGRHRRNQPGSHDRYPAHAEARQVSSSRASCDRAYPDHQTNERDDSRHHQQHPSPADGDMARHRSPHGHPDMDLGRSHGADRPGQPPKQPFTCGANPLGQASRHHPNPHQDPFSHGGHQGRRRDGSREQRPDTRVQDLTPPEGALAGQNGRSRYPRAVDHRSAARVAYNDRPGSHHRSQQQQPAGGSGYKQVEYDRPKSREADRHDVARSDDRLTDRQDRRVFHSNSRVSPPSGRDARGGHTRPADRQSDSYHPLPQEDARQQSREAPHQRNPSCHSTPGADRPPRSERPSPGSMLLPEGRSPRGEGPFRGDRSHQGVRPSRHDRQGSRDERGSSRDERGSSRGERQLSREERQLNGRHRRSRSSSADRDRSKRSKASGFSGEAAPHTSVAGDPGSAAAAVMRMQGHPTGTGLTLQQKKSKLWGSKAAPTDAAQADAGYGANRWDTANFTNETDKEKFSRLMGVNKVAPAPSAAQPSVEDEDRDLFSKERQDRVLEDLESQFITGLRRKDGRTVGLGL